jgi:hypothetical protein
VTTRLRLWIILVFFASLSLVSSYGQEDIANGTGKVEQKGKSFAGCYELRLGRWWPWGMGDDTPLATPPTQIELKLERGKDYFEKDELLIRQIGSATRAHGSSFWVPTDDSAVLLVWTNGFSGVSLRLRKSGSDLQGWAHAHFDFPRPPHVAHVVATPVACGSPN